MPDKSKSESTIRILKNSSRCQLRPHEIIRLEAEINYTSLFTATDNFIIAKTLKELEQVLGTELFLRTHKSHLVNKSQIAGLTVSGEERKVILKTGESVQVARRRLKTVLSSLNPY